MQFSMPNMYHNQVRSLFTHVDPVGPRGGEHLNSKAHVRSLMLLQSRTWCVCVYNTICGDFCLYLFVFQVARGRARRDVHTQSIRSGSWRGSSFSAFTSTKRSVCSSHGCSIWQIARWKSGFRTGGWRRRNWTETVYSTSLQTPSYKKLNKDCMKAVTAWHTAVHPLIWRLHNYFIFGQDDEVLMCQTS